MQMGLVVLWLVDIQQRHSLFFRLAFVSFLRWGSRQRKTTKWVAGRRAQERKESVDSSAGALGYSCRCCYNNNFRIFLTRNSWSSRLSDSRCFFTALWQLSFPLWDPRRARSCRCDNSDVTTNLCFHTATATILLSHHTTTFPLSHTNSFTPQHLPFSFHTKQQPDFQ